MTKRFGVAFALGALVASAAPAWCAENKADAAGFPVRPIRIVVGFTPGGQPDLFARLIAPKLAESLHQPVVVDNRPGAGGIIGTQLVVNATADGYTLLSVSSAHAITPSIQARLPYDTLKDLAGVSMTATAPLVLVVPPALGVKTVQEFIALAKAKPGQLNFSSAGVGGGTHFAGEMFRQSARIDAVHVPYKGVPESLMDVVTGRVQFSVTPIASAVTLVREGKLRVLGVTTKDRSTLYPDIPAIAESGLPGFDWSSWSGLLLPAKTPRAIVKVLHRDTVSALGLPDVQQRLRAMGAEAAPSASPEQFDQFIVRQVKIVAELAKAAGITPQ